MAKKSNREEDARLEGIVNDFLDKYFFNQDFEKVQWVKDKKEQTSGVDVYLTSEKFKLDNAKVDIKSAVKYSTRYLPTYALEVSFINKWGEDCQGWLVNDKLVTEYYLLLYPRSQKYYEEMQVADDIDYIEYYLVKKTDIMDFLNSRGYDKERLKEVSDGMREEYIQEVRKGNGDPGTLRWNSDSQNFYFTLSGTLAEEPVNVVIKRQVYEHYSRAKGKIEKR